MLQETHSIEMSFLVRSMSGRVEFFSTMVQARGTMIAFTKNFIFKMEKYASDANGRIQTCSISHNNTNFF